MKKSKQEEFYSIVNDILLNDKYRELKEELHHGITRYDHCLRVAKSTFKTTKNMGLDYKTATRAALLHDFYTSNDLIGTSSVKALNVHPKKALENTELYFELNNVGKNIIESHMFPLGYKKPEYKEAWIVSIMDKKVAIYEMLRYKLSLKLGIYLIFLFNIATIKNIGY